MSRPEEGPRVVMYGVGCAIAVAIVVVVGAVFVIRLLAENVTTAP